MELGSNVSTLSPEALQAGILQAVDQHDRAGRLGIDNSARKSGSEVESARLPGNPTRGCSLKPAQRQMVQQAWDKHRRDQLLISCTPASLREASAAEHMTQYKL